MDLNEIAIFVKVVQSGSFIQAAKQLGMPNSTVSAKVSSLEKRLGVTLLHRTTRKLHITQAGQAFFDKCQLGISELKNAEEEVTLNQGEPQGLLRITAPSALGSSVLPEVFAKFASKYPKVQLELILQDRFVDMIAEGVDLAIRAGELKDSSLIAKKIGVNYFAPFASAGYLKTQGMPAHPKDLRNHRCLQYTPMGKEKWELVSREKQKVSIPMAEDIVADDLNAVKELALAGMGIALLPTFICGPELKKNKLVRVLPDWRSDVRPLNFVYPAQRFTNPKLQAFMNIAFDILKERLKELEF
ncbi:HTH-type transcriptional regulator DmlR [compost metagenome]